MRALPGAAGHEQFTVVFRVDGIDPQGGLFEVEHARAGRFPLLLSPCADIGARVTCQAHFSLLT